jgi:acyl-CoA thioester hydrolase
MRSVSVEPTAASYSGECEVRPKPFVVELFEGDPRFIREKGEGNVWHRCDLRTLYVDTDRSQVVYHSNYLRYFEYGRATLMRDVAYTYREIEESGFVYPIIKIDIDYYQPLYYDETMYIHTRPSTLERVRLQFDYVITHAETGNIVCKGFTRHCAVNASGTPVEVDKKTVHIWEIFPK